MIDSFMRAYCLSSEDGVVCCPAPYNCRKCGFNVDEAERRKSLPLVEDPVTGLLRKYVGKRSVSDAR